MVLGSHICDVMRIFLGDPKWVVAHVTQDGEELNRRHPHQATEPIGPVAETRSPRCSPSMTLSTGTSRRKRAM